MQQAGVGGPGASLDSGDWRKALKLDDVPDASDMAMLVQSCVELAAAAQAHPSGAEKLQAARNTALREIGDAENYVREQMAWRFPQR